MLTLQLRQLIHEVVERRQTPFVGRLRQVREVPLRLTREQCDAERHHLLQLPGDLRQHGQHTAHMKAADRDLKSGLAETSRQIHGAGELVGLNPH